METKRVHPDPTDDNPGAKDTSSSIYYFSSYFGSDGGYGGG
jgi:hypothetical protein